jgi:hypothetical protein
LLLLHKGFFVLFFLALTLLSPALALSRESKGSHLTHLAKASHALTSHALTSHALALLSSLGGLEHGPLGRLHVTESSHTRAPHTGALARHTLHTLHALHSLHTLAVHAEPTALHELLARCGYKQERRIVVSKEYLRYTPVPAQNTRQQKATALRNDQE